MIWEDGQGRAFYNEGLGKGHCVLRSIFPTFTEVVAAGAAGAAAKSLQWCLTLRDPMDCSLSGSSVRGILWARVLEWVAITFSD